MTKCNRCGKPIEWKNRFDGKKTSFDHGTNNFHYCKPEDKEAYQDKIANCVSTADQEKIEANLMVVQKMHWRNVCDWYLERGREVPDVYATFEAWKAFEAWQEEELGESQSSTKKPDCGNVVNIFTDDLPF